MNRRRTKTEESLDGRKDEYENAWNGVCFYDNSEADILNILRIIHIKAAAAGKCSILAGENRYKQSISKRPDCFFHFSTLFSGLFFAHSLSVTAPASGRAHDRSHSQVLILCFFFAVLFPLPLPFSSYYSHPASSLHPSGSSIQISQSFVASNPPAATIPSVGLQIAALK